MLSARGWAEGQEGQDTEPSSAGLALLCPRGCRQGRDPGLAQHTLPMVGHRLSPCWSHLTLQEQGSQCCQLLFGVMAGVIVNQIREIGGLTSHMWVLFCPSCLLLPLRKLLSWPWASLPTPLLCSNFVLLTANSRRAFLFTDP